MQEITLKDIFAILRKRLVLIIFIPLVVAIGAGIYFMQQPNEYTAKAKLYVLMDYTDSTGQIRYDTSSSTQFTGDFKELITTHKVLEETARRLGSDVKQFSNGTLNISVSSVSGTRIIEIGVTSASPTMSLEVTNTLSKVFVEYVRDLLQTESVSIAAEATLPTSPSGPARLRNTLLAYVLALAAVIGICLAVEMLNTTIRTVEQAETALELPVLASVTNYRDELAKFMNTESNRVPLTSILSSATHENIKTLATNVQFAAMGTPVRTIAVTSTLATEGKSTITIMLAEALADEGYHVLICDLDVRRPSIGRYAGRRNRNDIIDYMTSKASLRDVVTPMAKTNTFFIDCRHKISSASQIVNYENFDSFINVALNNFDYVLFDTPPLGMFIDAAVLSAKVDGVLMVLGNGMIEQQHARDAVEQLHKANANIIGTVLNYVVRPKSNRYYYYSKKYGYRYYSGYSAYSQDDTASEPVKALRRKRTARSEGTADDIPDTEAPETPTAEDKMT